MGLLAERVRRMNRGKLAVPENLSRSRSVLTPSLQRKESCKQSSLLSKSSGNVGRGVLCPQLCLRLCRLLFEVCCPPPVDFGVERSVTLLTPKLEGDENRLGSNGGKSASWTSIENRNSRFFCDVGEEGRELERRYEFERSGEGGGAQGVEGLGRKRDTSEAELGLQLRWSQGVVARTSSLEGEWYIGGAADAELESSSSV